jgi:hypothetical protein
MLRRYSFLIALSTHWGTLWSTPWTFLAALCAGRQHTLSSRKNNSVFCGHPLYVIDDHDVCRNLAGLQSETELFLQRREERKLGLSWSPCIGSGSGLGRCIRRPFQLEVVHRAETGLVENGLAEHACESIGELGDRLLLPLNQPWPNRMVGRPAASCSLCPPLATTSANAEIGLVS